MAPKEVVDYIKQEMRAGHSPADISKALKDVGWEDTEVQEAFTEIGLPGGSTPSPAPATPVAPETPQFPGAASAPVEARPIEGLATTPASEPLTSTGDQGGVESPANGETAIAGTDVTLPTTEPEQPAIASTPGSSLLDRNLATRPGYSPTGSSGSPELQSSGLSRLQSKTGPAPANLPTSGAISSGLTSAGSPSPAPSNGGNLSSRLGSQSTGSSLADFTGTSTQSPVSPATHSPAAVGQMVTPSSPASASTITLPNTKPAKQPKQAKRAGGGWYILIGFLLGVLITLFVIGGYINFFA